MGENPGCRRALPWCDCTALEREIDVMRAKVERLRADAQAAAEIIIAVENSGTSYRAADHDALLTWALGVHPACASMDGASMRSEVRAEVERLRAAPICPRYRRVDHGDHVTHECHDDPTIPIPTIMEGPEDCAHFCPLRISAPILPKGDDR